VPIALPTVIRRPDDIECVVDGIQRATTLVFDEPMPVETFECTAAALAAWLNARELIDTHRNDGCRWRALAARKSLDAASALALQLALELRIPPTISDAIN
jgi:hypothetical protein